MVRRLTHRRIYFWGLMALVLAATGCGDSPAVLMHEFNSLQNEFADVMVKIKDEETAKLYLDTKLKKLWAKADYLGDRSDKIFEIEDQAVEYAALDARFDTLDENVVGAWRVVQQIYRLKEIRYQLFIEEMEKRQQKGILPSCIDKDMYTLFSSRVLTPEMEDFAKYEEEMRDRTNELLKSGDKLPPMIMVTVAKGKEEGPKIIFVDIPRYKYYLQVKGTIRQKPSAFAVRKPLLITSDAVNNLLAALTKLWEDNNKKGPQPTATQAFEDIVYPPETESQVVVLNLSGGYSLLTDPNVNKPDPAYKMFFDEGLSTQIYAKRYMPSEEYIINAATLWPSLTEITTSTDKLNLKDIWKNDPFSQTVSNSAGGGGGAGPAPPGPPPAGPAPP